MAIPKIIHQSWKTEEIKPEWRGFQRSIREKHPDWDYHLWTDEDNRQLVARHYPAFLDTFDALPSAIMRADSARYVYMYALGGLYADLDYEFLRPFDYLEEKIVLPISREADHKDGFRLGNCILASEPGHPFWEELLQSLISDPPRSAEGVEQATGPIFVTKTYALKKRSGYCLPARSEFHPETPKSTEEYNNIKNDGAYGIHYCSGTWRPRKTLLRKIGRLFMPQRFAD